MGSFEQVGDEDEYFGTCGNAGAGHQKVVTSENTTTGPKPSSLTTHSKEHVFNLVGAKIGRRSTSPSQWVLDEEKVGPSTVK